MRWNMFEEAVTPSCQSNLRLRAREMEVEGKCVENRHGGAEEEEG